MTSGWIISYFITFHQAELIALEGFPSHVQPFLFRVLVSFGSFRYQMQQLQSKERSNPLDHAGSVTWKVVPCIWPAQILYYIYGLILSYIMWQANSSKPMQVTSVGHQRFSGFGHGMSWSSIWRVNHFSSSPSPNVHCYPNPGSCQCDFCTTFEWSSFKP